MLPAGSVDNTALAAMLAARIKGRALGAGNGPPQDLLGSQVAAILNADPAPGAYPLLATLIAANSTVLNFTLGDNAKFASYRVLGSGIQPASDNALLTLRGSTNNGASFDTGVSYNSIMYYANTGGVNYANYAGQSYMALSVGIGSAYRRTGLTLDILPDSSGGGFTQAVWQMFELASGAVPYSIGGGGEWALGIMNAFQFFFTAGNILNGVFRVYGIPR